MGQIYIEGDINTVSLTRCAPIRVLTRNRGICILRNRDQIRKLLDIKFFQNWPEKRFLISDNRVAARYPGAPMAKPRRPVTRNRQNNNQKLNRLT